MRRRERRAAEPERERVARLAWRRAHGGVADTLAEDDREDLRFRRRQCGVEMRPVAAVLPAELAREESHHVQAQQHRRVAELRDAVGVLAEPIVTMISRGVANVAIEEREPTDGRPDRAGGEHAFDGRPER